MDERQVEVDVKIEIERDRERERQRQREIKRREEKDIANELGNGEIARGSESGFVQNPSKRALWSACSQR